MKGWSETPCIIMHLFVVFDYDELAFYIALVVVESNSSISCRNMLIKKIIIGLISIIIKKTYYFMLPNN